MRRLNADSRTPEVTDATVSRIDARLDTAEVKIDALALVDVDFEARIEALEAAGPSGGVSTAKALTMAFLRC